jgi:hypothetical protein
VTIPETLTDPSAHDLGASAVALGERVQQAAAAAFQGRAAELAHFLELMARPGDLPRILNVYGPAGVGKTAFLEACRRACERYGLGRVVIVDGREFPHTLEGLVQAIKARIPDWPAMRRGERTALMIDTYEEMAEMDRVFRERFLQGIEGPVLIVVSGRHSLLGIDTEWTSWHPLFEQIRLMEFSAEESRRYLQAQGMADPAVIASILDFACGNVLALTLAADLALQMGVTDFSASASTMMIMRSLTLRLFRNIKHESTRDLLGAAALLPSFDQDLLAFVVGKRIPEPFPSFCHELSLVERGPRGYAFNGLVRRLLADDLHWRRPQRYREYKRRVDSYLALEPTGDRVESWNAPPASGAQPLEEHVKDALERLDRLDALGESPLTTFSNRSDGGAAPARQLRAVLVEVMRKLASSPSKRDAQAGALLLDYYVHRIGSHQLIAERLGLARATFYRRFHRGLALVAERLRARHDFEDADGLASPPRTAVRDGGGS